MIDEQQHDLAIEYLFGHLKGDALREFEAWLQSDEEMRVLVDELRETTAALALAAPQHLPPPHLRAKVLEITRGEVAAPDPASTPSSRWFGWLPWAIAASLAVAGVVLAVDRHTARLSAKSASAEITKAAAAAAAAHAEAEKIRAQVSGLTGRLQLSEVQNSTYVSQISELRDEVVKLRGHDALAQMKIAALNAQVAQFAKAGVVIVWDPEEQRGVVRLVNLPKPTEGKDYQLWLIDPKYPDPVNGGVLTVSDASPTRVPFKPDQLVENANKFAISLEQAGGVPKAAGPIIFLGE
ncbi:MAG: anti-sigma factor [Chthoniobacteraceae bacterium]